MYHVYYANRDYPGYVLMALISAGNKAQAVHIHKKWAKSVGIKVKIKDVVFTREATLGAS